MDNQEKTIVTDVSQLSKEENFWQAFKFVLFSISAGAIQIVSFTLLNLLWKKIFADSAWLETDFGIFYAWMTSKYGLSYFIALVLSVIWNFTINRKFTFKSANNVKIAMLKIFGYYCVFTPLSLWWGIALERAGWNEYLILLPTMVINMVTELLFSRYFIYRHSVNTALIGKQ